MHDHALTILCLIFVSVSPASLSSSLLEYTDRPGSIVPCTLLVALSRTLCTRANLDCFRCGILDSPPPPSSSYSLTFRFSRRFVSIGYFRPSVVVLVVVVDFMGSHIEKRRRGTMRTCMCVNRVEFELILITSREVVLHI